MISYYPSGIYHFKPYFTVPVLFTCCQAQGPTLGPTQGQVKVKVMVKVKVKVKFKVKVIEIIVVKTLPYHSPLASLSMDFPFEIGLVASANFCEKYYSEICMFEESF